MPALFLLQLFWSYLLRRLHRVGERPEDVVEFTAHDLRDYLRYSFGKRLIDHFKGMDTDASGELSKKEFRQAVARLGFVRASRPSVDEAFTVLDEDHSGQLGYTELDKKLRRLGDRPEDYSWGGMLLAG